MNNTNQPDHDSVNKGGDSVLDTLRIVVGKLKARVITLFGEAVAHESAGNTEEGRNIREFAFALEAELLAINRAHNYEMSEAEAERLARQWLA